MSVWDFDDPPLTSPDANWSASEGEAEESPGTARRRKKAKSEQQQDKFEQKQDKSKLLSLLDSDDENDKSNWEFSNSQPPFFDPAPQAEVVEDPVIIPLQSNLVSKSSLSLCKKTTEILEKSEQLLLSTAIVIDDDGDDDDITAEEIKKVMPHKYVSAPTTDFKQFLANCMPKPPTPAAPPLKSTISKQHSFSLQGKPGKLESASVTACATCQHLIDMYAEWARNKHNQNPKKELKIHIDDEVVDADVTIGQLVSDWGLDDGDVIDIYGY